MKHKLRHLLFAALLASATFISPVQAITDPRFFIGNDILFYDDECKPGTSGESMQLAGDDNEQKILNFFMRKGLSLAQAAGIVGNMMVESRLQPNIREGGQLVGEDYVPENGVGFGLVQWTFDARQKPLVAHIQGLGVPITDLGGQLSFVWEELNGKWLPTLNKLRATDDPVEAAIIVHNEYEVSAQSAAQVRATRGKNAQEVYDKYKDADALAGESADDALQNPGGSPDGDNPDNSQKPPSTQKRKECSGSGFSGGNFNETLKHYAWSEWKGLTIEARPEYTEAYKAAKAQGLYIGGIAHPGIDCGGFVTLLVRDSGFDKGYNYDGKGGYTPIQEQWMKENWQTLGPSSSIDPSSLQPGDVAVNAQHTFIYVGEVPGFEAKIASASLDERAPMADTRQQPTQPGFNWYRKK
ncbi:MAG: phage tail tip lysozyme [Candidatus Saccharibacteria bacterium]|nr:phage tail tip lysozyme [Candidatus Saccharibacteria bacterium]